MGKILAWGLAVSAFAPVSFARGSDPLEQSLLQAVSTYTSAPPPLPLTAATPFNAGVARLQLVLDLYYPSPSPAELQPVFKGIAAGVKKILAADRKAGGGVVDLAPLDFILAACTNRVESRVDQYGNEYGTSAPAYLAASLAFTRADEVANSGDRVRALKFLSKALKLVRAAGVVDPENPPPGPTPILGITHPVLFVDGPRNGTPPGPTSMGIGAVEFPEIESFAPYGALRTRETRLKMIHPDGTLETLYGWGNGAVLHPSVSFDGTKIYFAYNPDVGWDEARFDVYRMDWT
ncbi:MAG TPA: hypothetical protein VKF62_09285, partial [Planctomycetota bacterium]|nr:hypothetical protein [Planctomycetota bacterium]